MTKLLTIDLRSTAHRMLGSRGNPSQFVLYGLKNMCAKFDAFTPFVTIFPLTDRTKKHRAISNQEKMAFSPPPPVGLNWDSPPPPPESARMGVQANADVTTKISRIDRLPNSLTHGAPFYGLRPQGSSAVTFRLMSMTRLLFSADF